VMMNLETHEVSVDNMIVGLTLKEFNLLQVFLESPGHVLSRQELLDRVWGIDYALDEHALDVHVHNLRRKIESSVSPQLIMTVRGIGYKLCANRETGKLSRQRKDSPFLL
jgi:two-component system, OmpR family, response regulator RegX3